jgi:hypothetical protein
MSELMRRVEDRHDLSHEPITSDVERWCWTGRFEILVGSCGRSGGLLGRFFGFFGPATLLS